jgi:DNA-binding NtrC family response regulator
MLNILLVDDETEFLFTTSELLTLKGFKVYSASSVREAHAVLKNSEIDIVVADIILPEHDGFEMIMFLNEHYPQIKIIAISGGGRIDKLAYLKLAQGLEVSATLAKPFLVEELISTIKSIS